MAHFASAAFDLANSAHDSYDEGAMVSPFMNVEEFKTRLRPLLEEFPGGAVAFDADGTLWRHDVGCMVYDYFCSERMFLPESRIALADELQRIGGTLAPNADANQLAHELRRRWYEGKYAERSVSEMQVWAYVGYREQQFREVVTQALRLGGHTETLHGEVMELADWVRRLGGRALVVSASPLWVVEEATRAYGFAAADIAAGVPNTLESKEPLKGTAERRIQAGMSTPLPYGPDKVVAGRRLIQGAEWLAALGDSVFDLDMMAAAKLAGGIGNKPEMLQGLALLPHGVRLRLS